MVVFRNVEELGAMLFFFNACVVIVMFLSQHNFQEWMDFHLAGSTCHHGDKPDAGHHTTFLKDKE